MALQAKPKAEKDRSERWLLTYADLITLLMVFFVVLYSMSQADSDKFKRISAAILRARGSSTGRCCSWSRAMLWPSTAAAMCCGS